MKIKKTKAIAVAAVAAFISITSIGAEARTSIEGLQMCSKPGSSAIMQRESCRPSEKDVAIALCENERSSKIVARGDRCRRGERRLGPSEAAEAVLMLGDELVAPGGGDEPPVFPGGILNPGGGGETEKPVWDVDCYDVGNERCCSWSVYFTSTGESSAGVDCAPKE